MQNYRDSYRSPQRSTPNIYKYSSNIPNYMISPKSIGIQNNEAFNEMQQIKQEHFYIQKLRIQRQRMQLLKDEFVKKDKYIQSQKEQIIRLCEQIQKQKLKSKKHDLLQSDFTRLQQENKNLNIQRNNLKKNMEDSKKQLLRFSMLIKEKDQQIQMLKLQNNDLFEANRNLIEELERQKNHFLQNNNDHCRQKQILKTKWGYMKNELDQLRKQNQHLMHQNKNYYKQLENFKNELHEKQLQIIRQEDRIILIKEELDKTLQGFDEYKNNLMYRSNEEYHILQQKLIKVEQRCKKYEKKAKKLKGRQLEKEHLLNQLKCEMRRQLQKKQSLQNEIKNQQTLIYKYKNTQKNYIELIERLKNQISELQEKYKNYQKLPEKKLKNQLERLRKQLYMLRNVQVDKIERVFNSFGIDQKQF